MLVFKHAFAKYIQTIKTVNANIRPPLFEMVCRTQLNSFPVYKGFSGQLIETGLKYRKETLLKLINSLKKKRNYFGN